MENIEREDENANVLALGREHLAGCLALSKSANWNQNEADWRLMLGFGRGWGVSIADGSLAATTLVLPYGTGFAWVAMVLVLPECRRKGYATQLLRLALATLKNEGRTPVLDATPAGREVYLQEGFRDTWGFTRHALKEKRNVLEQNNPSRPLADSDWPQILGLDRRAFGASREILLRNLAARLPQAALVVERQGAIEGFVLGRDGREANQVGPLVAKDESTASALLEAAVGRTRSPIYLDIADHAPALQACALALGFEFQRAFMRMVHGDAGKTAGAPGEASLVHCPAGPELG